ncbi:RDD family protein [Brevibacillus sp. TJ4]|uniref:RDD family protein n=1 Tax=Brevibacillus sp. TJ4 TaxID=3234853 RepID=UPI0037D3EEEE
MHETTIDHVHAPKEVAVHYAGFWIRVAALFLDSLFLLGTSLLIFQPLRRALGFSSALFSVVDGLEVAFGFLYACLLTWWSGQTLGKMVFGIRVVTTGQAARQTLSFGQVVLREVLGKTLSAIPFGLGYLWAGWTKRKQGWHDLIANTYVVWERRSS